MFLSLVTIVLLSTAMMSLSLQQSTDNNVVMSKFKSVANAIISKAKSLINESKL
jgi:hypothetical protein